MKYIAYLMVGAALLSGCKKRKEYTCSCVTTVFYGFSQYSYRSTAEKMDKKLTEKQARSVCSHEAASIDKTYSNFLTGNGNFQNNTGFTQETACNLQ